MIDFGHVTKGYLYTSVKITTVMYFVNLVGFFSRKCILLTLNTRDVKEVEVRTR